MSSDATPGFHPLTGLYEPSAIVQLPDGRFLVVEDEQSHPFSLLTIGADSRVRSTPLTPGLLQWFSALWKLDDLEGLALDRAGWLYAINSHSRDNDGDTKKSREKLVRFRIEGQAVVESKVVDGLKRPLCAQHPVLAAAAKVRDVKADGGLNIEALEVGPDPQRLLIGMRSPLHHGRALIASVENLSALFDRDESPRVAAALDELDLGGQGIRGLSYVASIGGYLVIAGPTGRGRAPFELWFWSGDRGAPARRVSVAGVPGFAHAEGVCAAVIDGAPRIVIVSDDGNRQAGHCASFLLLDPGQLQIAP